MHSDLESLSIAATPLQGRQLGKVRQENLVVGEELAVEQVLQRQALQD